VNWFTKPLSKATAIPQANPSLPPTAAELQHLAELRQVDRVNKAEFDAASAVRKDYEHTHRILDAISIYKGNGFKRVAAMRENPAYGELWAVEQTAQRRWWVSRKAICDLEFALGVKK